MKITDLKVTILSVPVDAPQRASFGSMKARNTAVVEIHTDAGISGVGESWINFPHWGWKERKATLEDGIRPLVIGEDPRQIGKIVRDLHANLVGVCRQWGATGVAYQAISGVDIALWDIFGKSLDVPVHALLGGAGIADTIPYYASGIDSSRAPEVVDRWLARGCRSFKIKVGLDSSDEAESVRRVSQMLPDAASVMIDATQRWTRTAAVRFLSDVEDVPLTWVEEPVACDDYPAMREVRAAGVPLAAGENTYGLRGFRRLMETESIDIVQPDVTKAGGISSMRDVVTLARAWDIPYAPHVYGSAIGLVASLQIMAALPGGVALEVDSTENPLQTELLETAPSIQDGNVRLPDGAGLGISLNRDFMERYRLE